MSKKNMLVKWNDKSWHDIDDVVHVNDERIDALLRPSENNRIFDHSVENNKKYYYSFGPDMSTGGHRLYDLGHGNYNPLDVGPGPVDFIGGDMSHGFFGEVSAMDFITGDDLASRLGITQGTSINSGTDWLKFCLDGKIIFVPKKPHRGSISWDHIYNAGAVYESQNTIVTIDGFDFRVTLLRGANQDPVPSERGYDPSYTHGSEWNRLMYPIHSGVHVDSSNPSNPSEPYNQWASYSDVDLSLHSYFVSGIRFWCQESNGSDRLQRGGYGVSYATSVLSSLTNTSFGWRAALRLVQ